MTEQEQRIAIAEACGWRVEYPKYSDSTPMGILYFNPKGSVCDLPDYLHDLNSMHNAEECLTADQARKYHEWIQKIGHKYPWQAWVWHTPANQLSEAFLRTIGKWKD